MPAVLTSSLRVYLLELCAFAYTGDIGERLGRFKLFQYLEVFVSEGFDNWATVLNITESNL
jgi:hypothetical protein